MSLDFDDLFCRYVLYRNFSKLYESLLRDLSEVHRKLRDESVTALSLREPSTVVTNRTDETPNEPKDLRKILNAYRVRTHVGGNMSRDNTVRSLYRLNSAGTILAGLKRVITEQCETVHSVDPKYSSSGTNQENHTCGISVTHYRHVQDGLKLLERRQLLLNLTRKRDALKDEILRLSENKSIVLDKLTIENELALIGSRAEFEFLQRRLHEMREQAVTMKSAVKKVVDLKASLKLFHEKMVEKRQLLTQLRTENRQLSSNLPGLQNLARERKEALVAAVQCAFDSIERLQSQTPMQRILAVSPTDEPFTWKVNAQGVSCHTLLHNVVSGLEIYQACCSQLGICGFETSPDVPLRAILSLAYELRMRTEHMEILRHILMIVQEESCTTSKLQKSDLKVQEKVRQRMEPQLSQIRQLVDEIKANLSSSDRFINDWKQALTANVPATTVQVRSD